MNPYCLEMGDGAADGDLRRDLERSHRLADLLTRRFRSRRAGRRLGAVCADVTRAVEPGPA